MKAREKRSKWVTTLLLLFCLIIFLLPFYFILVNAFKPMSEIAENGFALPKTLSLDNFRNAFTRLNFANAMKNTVVVTLLSNIGGLVMGSMAGYWLARKKNKVTAFIYFVFIGSMAIPFQAIMIPFAKVARTLHMTNSLWGLAVAFWAFTLPISIFMTVGAMKNVPIEVEEAARIDGCSSFRMFWTIVFPLIRPAVITFVIINTFWFWNDYLLTQMMLSRKALRTIQLAMQAMFNDAFYAWDTALAALTLSIIPLLIFFIILQRNIIEGMSAGSVKG